jgi:EAL domain-containing protein (putative c-di-GMP-specific phosphodiesterase class I)
VEDEAQALFLRAAGCDRLQGFLFARPMPAEAVEARLRESASATGPLPAVTPARLRRAG